MKFKKASAALVIALMLIALEVFIGKLVDADMWISIALYWAVLTIKNFCDWRASRERD